ncbi:MAG: hypothetical protein Q8M07_12950 [Prosthecobacter sp.]|nr:hypothetical protein [Prosthecobacter sp.]
MKRLLIFAPRLIYLGCLVMACPLLAMEPIDIGSRRELFVDDFLIEKLRDTELKLHNPEPREVVLVCNQPWEGNTSFYFLTFQDGGLFRMYYRGSHFDESSKSDGHEEVTCYAESKDGITWSRPKLGLHEFAGSKDNNIIWRGWGAHNFTPFKDTNPACAPDARYKALVRAKTNVDGKEQPCVHACKSADGLRWTLLTEQPVLTAGTFDSQNLAAWDAQRGEYRAYWRAITSKVRGNRTATSQDFITWEQQCDLDYDSAPVEQLYTNVIEPYFLAPHLSLGFPTRLLSKGYQTEPVFMSSRDGVAFRRWPQAIIPTDAPEDRDGNRSNFMAHGLLQLPGNPRELSVYATEAYYKGTASRLRRFAYRVDGFVSLHATAGEVLTKPVLFNGKHLELNCLTSASGSIRVEVQDASGQPLPGYSLADCDPITGDDINRRVKWSTTASLAALTGQPVRLRFVLTDADLYALRFAD